MTWIEANQVGTKILRKWKNPKGLQESGKDKDNAFRKQNELTKYTLPY